MLKRSFALLLACGALLATFTACSSGNKTSSFAQSNALSGQSSADAQSSISAANVPGAMLTPEEATALFAEAYPGIDVQKVELQVGDGGREQYFMLAIQDGYKYKYIVDAYDGSVLLDEKIATNQP